MKNLLHYIAIIYFSVSLYSCDKVIPVEENQYKSIDPRIISFLGSKEFKRFEKSDLRKNYSEINFEKSFVKEFIINDTKYYNLNLVFGKENIEAVLETVIVPKIVDLDRLPNKDQYVMVLRDYQSFDLKSKEGTISIFDLNFDNFKTLQIETKKSEIKKWERIDFPFQLKEKYQSVFEKNSNYNVGKLMSTRSSIKEKPNGFCDGNNDGNISYSECYSCMKNACNSDSLCQTMCEIFDLFAGQCTGSIAASCVIISMIE